MCHLYLLTTLDQRDDTAERKLHRTWKVSSKMYLKFSCFFLNLLPPSWSPAESKESPELLSQLLPFPAAFQFILHRLSSQGENGNDYVEHKSETHKTLKKQREKDKEMQWRTYIKNTIEECFLSWRSVCRFFKAHYIPGIINENQGITRHPISTLNARIY